ncbi:hypothetical protein AB0M22_45320 [Nocardia sp. NPDC051756]|uniref:hypothetical protein n=1 Tax=Nocardia sp. NPDC051756 TaxID=3154751 RepID=UPI00344684C1
MFAFASAVSLAAMVAVCTVGGVAAAPAHAQRAVPVLAHAQLVYQPHQEPGDEDDDDAEGGAEPTISKVKLEAGRYCGGYIREQNPEYAVVDSEGHGVVDSAMYHVRSDGTVVFDNECTNCVSERGLSNSRKVHPRCNY